MVIYKHENRGLGCLNNLLMSVFPYYSLTGGLNRGLVESRVCVSSDMMPENWEITKFKCRTSAIQSTYSNNEYWDVFRKEIMGFLGQIQVLGRCIMADIAR